MDTVKSHVTTLGLYSFFWDQRRFLYSDTGRVFSSEVREIGWEGTIILYWIFFISEMSKIFFFFRATAQQNRFLSKTIKIAYNSASFYFHSRNERTNFFALQAYKIDFLLGTKIAYYSDFLP